MTVRTRQCRTGLKNISQLWYTHPRWSYRFSTEQDQGANAWSYNKGLIHICIANCVAIKECCWTSSKIEQAGLLDYVKSWWIRKLNNNKNKMNKKTMSQHWILAWLVIVHQTEESHGVAYSSVKALRKKATTMMTEKYDLDWKTGLSCPLDNVSTLMSLFSNPELVENIRTIGKTLINKCRSQSTATRSGTRIWQSLFRQRRHHKYLYRFCDIKFRCSAERLQERHASQRMQRRHK